MILILSQDSYEPSTDNVISWIEHLGGYFIRLNGNSFADTFSCLNLSDPLNTLNTEKINICWLRRWIDYDSFLDFLSNKELSSENRVKLNAFLTGELGTISGLLWSSLKDKKWLTKPAEVRHNKLNMLLEAKSAGLEIPDTIITCSKEDVIKFKSKHTRVITKSLSENGYIRTDSSLFLTCTTEVSSELLETVASEFFPSMFQEYIEKEFEIRSFYLEGEIYSMAIFSQSDDQTKLDYKNYNLKNPNRVVPFLLPEYIKSSIVSLMNTANFSTCSIDIIKSKDNRYVFLECNPVGQFNMVSYNCNYYLNQKIAQHLISNDK